MTKIIQPLSDPDEIREQAGEATKEEFADYYINQPAPDPLTWQSPVTRAEQPTVTVSGDDTTAPDEASNLSRQNDPLKDA